MGLPVYACVGPEGTVSTEAYSAPEAFADAWGMNPEKVEHAAQLGYWFPSPVKARTVESNYVRLEFDPQSDDIQLVLETKLVEAPTSYSLISQYIREDGAGRRFERDHRHPNVWYLMKGFGTIRDGSFKLEADGSFTRTPDPYARVNKPRGTTDAVLAKMFDGLVAMNHNDLEVFEQMVSETREEWVEKAVPNAKRVYSMLYRVNHTNQMRKEDQ